MSAGTALASEVGTAAGAYLTGRKRRRTDYDEPVVGDDTTLGITGSHIKIHVNPKLYHFVRNSFVRTAETYQKVIVGQVGEQGVGTLCELGSMGQALGAGGVPTTTNLMVPGYQIIPSTAMLSNAYYNTTTPVNAQDPLCQRFAMKHVQLKMDVHNGCNSDVVVEIFFVKSLQNIPSVATGTANVYTYHEASTVWADCLAAESDNKPIQTFASAVASNTAGGESIAMPGAVPGDSRTFRGMFKLLKKHQIRLAPGANEIVDCQISMNKAFSVGKLSAMLQSGTPSLNQVQTAYPLSLMKGGLAVFAIVRGAPYKDTTNGIYSYSLSEVGFVIQRKISWVGLPNSQENFLTVQARGGVEAVTAVAPKVITENTIVPATPQAE